MKRLTLKQMRYVQWFILCLANGTAAARLAGYHCPKQASYRLHHTLSVRIFMTWKVRTALSKYHLPMFDAVILKQELLKYGYTVDLHLVMYAVKHEPYIPTSTFNRHFQRFTRNRRP